MDTDLLFRMVGNTCHVGDWIFDFRLDDRGIQEVQSETLTGSS